MTSATHPEQSLIGGLVGGRFLVKEQLDDTGRAHVYRAEHVLFHREAALKVARTGFEVGEESVSRFQRVARVATQLEHPNCVQIVDFGLDEAGYVYLAMELCPGRDLNRIVTEDGPLTAEEVVAVGLELLVGLGEAHQRGILHTELMPKYVMVDLSSGTPSVKILGFGLGQLMRNMEQGATTGQVLQGEPRAYAAPELLQVGTPVDHRADLHAVGAVLFCALTGKSPWASPRGNGAGRLDQPPRRPSNVRPDGTISMELDRVLVQAMDPDPHQRFSDAGEMAAALERSLGGDGRELSTVAPVHLPFGRYKLLRSIARGGMGELHLATSETLPGLAKVCAVKMLRPELVAEKSYVDRFLAEARLACQLSHANLATVYDVGKVDDSFYMAMEYVTGKDCRRIIDRAREDGLPVPVDVALYIGRELADALGYAHRLQLPDGEVGLIHRDVSPTNVIVSYEGSVKLIDFGLAKHATAVGKTETGVVMGKVAYMAPEQCLGDPLDNRTDIYSVGAVLFELLTGQRLREGADFERLAEIVREPPARLPSQIRRDAPPVVDQIIGKALAVDPAQRYQHAEGLRDDLGRVLTSLNSLLSRDTVAGFVKKIFMAEYQSEIKLSGGLVTQAPPERPESALGEQQRTASGTMARTEAMSVVSPEGLSQEVRDTFLATVAMDAIDPATVPDPVPATVSPPPLPDRAQASSPTPAPESGARPTPPPPGARAPTESQTRRDALADTQRMTEEIRVRRTGPGWLVVVVFLLLGLGGGVAGYHFVLKPRLAEPSPKTRRPAVAAGMDRDGSKEEAPMAAVMAAQPAPQPRVRPPTPAEIDRQAKKRVSATLQSLASRDLRAAGVRDADLPALPGLAEAFRKARGELHSGDLERGLAALGQLRRELGKKKNSCKKLRQRKYKWCKKARRKLRKAAPRKRAERRAFNEKVGLKRLTKRLKEVRRLSRKRKLSCAEQSLGYERLIPEFTEALRRAGITEEGDAKKGAGKEDR